MKWQELFNQELTQAEQARAEGNEGRARVCARRAASVVIAEYLNRKKLPDPGVSAIDRLRFLESLPGISKEIRQVANHLLLRVTNDRKLPVDVDLIKEVRWLEHELLDSVQL